MKPEWIVLIVVSILFVIFLVSYITYLKVFYSPKHRKEDIYNIPFKTDNKEFMISLIDKMKARPCEFINIVSFDGTRLSARYYHLKDGAPIHIQCHGYKGMALRDMCGGNDYTSSINHNSLVIDQRASGKSGGSTISFGANESKDLLCWIDYLISRFGKEVEIILSGVSMGATSVLLAACHDLPNNIKAVVADCPYSSAKDIICKVCEDMKLPSKLLFPFIALGALVFGHFNINKANVIKYAKNCKVPVLIIHGKEDDLISYKMSEQIYEMLSSKDKRIELFDNADHGMSFIVDSNRYNKVTEDFFISQGIKITKENQE